MSLLLDALKRAEQEKLARQAEAPAALPSNDRAPHATHAPRAVPPTPASGLELQPIAGSASSPGAGATLGVAPRNDPHAAQADLIVAGRRFRSAPTV